MYSVIQSRLDNSQSVCLSVLWGACTFSQSMNHWTFIHSIIQSFVHAFIHSFSQSFIHSVSQSFSQSVSQSLSRSFSQSCIHSVSQSFSHSFSQSQSVTVSQSVSLSVCLAAISMPHIYLFMQQTQSQQSINPQTCSQSVSQSVNWQTGPREGFEPSSR